jgi:hypothetical protein
MPYMLKLFYTQPRKFGSEKLPINYMVVRYGDYCNLYSIVGNETALKFI